MDQRHYVEFISWLGHIKNCPRKNMVSQHLKPGQWCVDIDQDLPNCYVVNFSRDKIKNKNSILCLWSEFTGPGQK